MPVLFRAIDPFGTPVTCDESRWINHVVRGHREMAGREAPALLTVEQPLEVYKSSTHVRRRVFYRAALLPQPWNFCYVRVIVEYTRSRRTEGRVITAFAAKTMRYTDMLLWPVPDIEQRRE